MGSLLWGMDNLLNDMVRPMTNAYQFKDYLTAAHMLRQLNMFLVGYGEGVDLPKFEPLNIDVYDRRTPEKYYKDYYDEYSEVVFKSMGIYIREMLDQIQHQNRAIPRNVKPIEQPIEA